MFERLGKKSLNQGRNKILKELCKEIGRFIPCIQKLSYMLERETEEREE